MNSETTTQPFVESKGISFPEEGAVVKIAEKHGKHTIQRECMVYKLPLTGFYVYLAMWKLQGETDDSRAILQQGVTISDVKNENISAQSLVEFGYKQAEITVKRIVDAEGQEVEYDRAWMRCLPEKDAQVIADHIAEYIADKASDGEKK